jgi:hypothetical protein
MTHQDPAAHIGMRNDLTVRSAVYGRMGHGIRDSLRLVYFWRVLESGSLLTTQWLLVFLPYRASAATTRHSDFIWSALPISSLSLTQTESLFSCSLSTWRIPAGGLECVDDSML